MRHRQERFATLVESGYSFAMGKSVYLETSVFSFYYDERVESAYRHQVTRELVADAEATLQRLYFLFCYS